MTSYELYYQSESCTPSQQLISLISQHKQAIMSLINISAFDVNDMIKTGQPIPKHITGTPIILAKFGDKISLYRGKSAILFIQKIINQSSSGGGSAPVTDQVMITPGSGGVGDILSDDITEHFNMGEVMNALSKQGGKRK
jgi:hypothetical protein